MKNNSKIHTQTITTECSEKYLESNGDAPDIG